jgi:hypothetical protein
MVRTDLIYSCAKQHNINVENLIFKKDNQYQTLSKSFNINGLESTLDIDIIAKFNKLRTKYNYLKNELNQYKLRHQLFSQSTENKEKYLEGIQTLDSIDFDNIKNNLISNIQEGLNLLTDLKSSLNDFKESIDSSLNTLKDNIPNIIGTNTIDNIFINYVSQNWKIYNTDSCYIDIPVDPNEYIIYTILETPNVELGYKVIGINSIYPMNGFSRIYLYKTNVDDAINNNYKVWYLAIKKDQNAY